MPGAPGEPAEEVVLEGVVVARVPGWAGEGWSL